MRLLWRACPGARDFWTCVLTPFLSGNILRAYFSTLLHPGVSVTTKSNQVSPHGTERIPLHLRQWEMKLLSFVGIGDRHATAFRRFERGEGKLKAVIYTAIILLVVYCGVKLIPPYVADYQLADKMQEQARFAVVNRYTEEQIRDNIFKIVQDLEIPTKREAIKVVSTNAVVKISLNYTVPVDLFFYHADLNFTPSSENKALF